MKTKNLAAAIAIASCAAIVCLQAEAGALSGSAAQVEAQGQAMLNQVNAGLAQGSGGSQSCDSSSAGSCAPVQWPSYSAKGSGGDPAAGYDISSSGMITEWGYATGPRFTCPDGHSCVRVYFPHPFPHSAMSVTSSLVASSWKYETQTVSFNSTSAVIMIPDGSTPGFSWEAIGY